MNLLRGGPVVLVLSVDHDVRLLLAAHAIARIAREFDRTVVSQSVDEVGLRSSKLLLDGGVREHGHHLSAVQPWLARTLARLQLT